MKVAGWLVGGWLLATTLAQAEPFVPVSDAQVLERLPRGLATPGTKAKDGPLVEAVASARQYLLAARESGDLRYLGYAEAMLSPWQQSPEPSAEFLLMRATLHQAQHRFDAALDDLAQVLERQPHNAQAWLTRAVIQQVIGNLGESRRSCARLLGLAPAMVVAACGAAASTDLASTEATYSLLIRHLEDASFTPDERRWALNVLAETAQRLGYWEEAEAHYRAALAVPGEDVYTLGALARLLLDRERPAAVLSLLAAAPDSDELLLLRARAARMLQTRDWPALRQQVTQRVEAIQRRGDNTHPGFVAEAALHVLDDPQQALSQARIQWQRQHEPRDLRLLLTAAQAADQPDAALPGLGWLGDTGYHDQRLQGVLDDLRDQTEES